jgi:hypothetical protein
LKRSGGYGSFGSNTLVHATARAYPSFANSPIN